MKPGYKQTDAGVIPDVWEVEPLRSFVRRHNSGVYKKSELYGKGCNIVGVSDLYSIDCVAGQRFAEVPLTPDERAKFTLACNDLVYGESSLVREGIARTVYVTERGAGTAFAWHTRRYAVDQSRLLSPYLYYYLQSHSARKHMMDRSIQTAITGINTVSYFACPILRPSLYEQRAIATALNDADALLDTLDRLIAKKHDLKQAAMQRLLTGQTRLPVFSEKWAVKRIGDFADCTAGGTPATNVTAYWGGSIRWMSSGELNLKRIAEVAGRITDAGLSNSSAKLVPPRCVLIGLAGQGKTRGTVAMNFVELSTNQSIAAVLPNDSFAPEYLYFNLDSRYEELRELSSGGGGRGGLNLKLIRSMAIPFPSVHEQHAIAAVLSDMDAEIDALEARRAKTHDLKQAMMQELLTGKTRLVQPEAAYAA